MGKQTSERVTLRCSAKFLNLFVGGALVFFGLSAYGLADARYGGGGGGSSTVDNTSPIISNINVAAGATKATITWTTNEDSISWITYGLTGNYGTENKTTTYNTSHSLVLDNLTPNTVYHYSIKSKDGSGNIGVNSDKTFTTLASDKIEVPTLDKPLSSMTLAELQAKINEIMAAIKKSQEQLSKIASGGTTGITGCSIASFTRTLKQGDSGEDVKCLQIILNSAADTRIAASGIGAPGNETIYFGGLTRGAVVRFQEKYRSEILAQWNLSAGTGVVGSSTIAKLNTLLKK